MARQESNTPNLGDVITINSTFERRLMRLNMRQREQWREREKTKQTRKEGMTTRDAEVTMTCVSAAHEVLRAATLDSEGSVEEAKNAYLNAATLMLDTRRINGSRIRKFTPDIRREAIVSKSTIFSKNN